MEQWTLFLHILTAIDISLLKDAFFTMRVLLESAPRYNHRKFVVCLAHVSGGGGCITMSCAVSVMIYMFVESDWTLDDIILLSMQTHFHHTRYPFSLF